MAKMTAPIQEVSRLLDLVPYLSTHSHISLKDLAQEFGVSEREMSNELMALSMCGLPGYTPYELIEVFFESGFVTINNHDALDIPRALTNLEVASLLIGLEIMRDSLAEGDEAIRIKIESLIVQLTALVGQVIAIEENPVTSQMAKVQKAIASRSQLSILYESALQGESSLRVIDPLSIYSENGQSYLNAYCQTAHGYRNFRLDRITRIDLIESPVTSPLEAGVEVSADSYSLIAHGRRRSISEHLNSEVAAEGHFSVNAFSPAWIIKTVVSFAPDLSLLTPGERRGDVRASLEEILALYRS